jgi:type I restriction enzyme S subunit
MGEENNEKLALVPRLRFPEFREAGEWANTTVEELSENVTAGGTPNTSEPQYWNGKIRWMNSGELNHKRVHEVQGRITDSGFRNSSTKLIPEKSVLIGLAGQGKTRGTVAMNMVELCINQSIAAIFPDQDKFSSDFLYHNLDNRYDELRRLSAGGEGRGGLNLQIIKSLGVPLPKLEEQQKIADCLSSLDGLIAAETQKLDALKTHKNGLMQQIFPREGETVPRLRFPDFQDAGEWEERRLTDVARLKNGYAFKSVDYVDVGPYQIITIANVQSGNLAIESTNKIAALPSDIQQHQVLCLGDILISMTGNVGRVCRVTTEGLLLNQRVGKLSPDKINQEFFYQSLQRDQFRNTMQLKAAGGAQGNLSAGDITEYGFRIPSDQGEQQKIADCLSSLDDLISAQSQKIDALKTHKKGLMQQLFPVLDEVQA